MAEPRFDPEAEVDEVEAVSLQGLAESWESDVGIRHYARQNGSLLNWGSPSAVGVCSMLLILKNSVLCFWYAPKS